MSTAFNNCRSPGVTPNALSGVTLEVISRTWIPWIPSRNPNLLAHYSNNRLSLNSPSFFSHLLRPF
jgi:hypothetical protein